MTEEQSSINTEDAVSKEKKMHPQQKFLMDLDTNYGQKILAILDGLSHSDALMALGQCKSQIETSQQRSKFTLQTSCFQGLS